MCMFVCVREKDGSGVMLLKGEREKERGNRNREMGRERGIERQIGRERERERGRERERERENLSICSASFQKTSTKDMVTTCIDSGSKISP